MTHEEAIHFAECLRNNWTIDFNDMEDFCKMAIDALQNRLIITEIECVREMHEDEHRYLVCDREYIRVVRCMNCIKRERCMFKMSEKDDGFCSFGERASDEW